MVLDLISFISLSALVLYLIFGGADYGAGILELFRYQNNVRDEQEQLISKAMGPVWEANHIWLILIIVILFNGFPTMFVTLTNALHIPLVAILLGIVVRGVTFTYRHYDTSHTLDRFYTWAFALSSLWTSIWLGVAAGAAVLGRIDPLATDAYSLYIAPWDNPFSFAVGLFIATLFAFLASAFLIGEAESERMKKFFSRRALASNLLSIASGGLVFLTAHWENYPLAREFASNPYSMLMMVLASSLSWLFVLFRLKRSATRILTAGIVTSVILGFYFLHAPAIVATKQGYLTFANTAAPAPTLLQLLIALGVGLVLIVPSLGLLIWIFKFKEKPKVLEES
jgi:cytochrome d ubiquinol oxidase subunit II